MACKTKHKRGMKDGGYIPDEYAGLLGAANLILPGLGTGLQVANKVLPRVISPTAFTPVSENPNPFGMADGGQINSISPRGLDQYIGENAFQVKYKGGGTDQKNYGNVNLDNGETVANDFVFTADHYVGNSNQTFAQAAKKISQKIEKNKTEQPYDLITQHTDELLNMNRNKLARFQESTIARTHARNMKDGGDLNGDPVKEFNKAMAAYKAGTMTKQELSSYADRAYQHYDSLGVQAPQAIQDSLTTISGNTTPSQGPGIENRFYDPRLATQAELKVQNYAAGTADLPPDMGDIIDQSEIDARVAKQNAAYQAERDNAPLEMSFDPLRKGFKSLKDDIIHLNKKWTPELRDEAYYAREKTNNQQPITIDGQLKPTSADPIGDIYAQLGITGSPAQDAAATTNPPVESTVPDPTQPQATVNTAATSSTTSGGKTGKSGTGSGGSKGTGSRTKGGTNMDYHGYTHRDKWMDDSGKVYDIKNRDDLKKYQQHLKNKGLYAGNIDGQWGRLTERGHRLGQGTPQTLQNPLQQYQQFANSSKYAFADADDFVTSNSVKDPITAAAGVKVPDATAGTGKGKFGDFLKNNAGDLLQGAEILSKFTQLGKPDKIEANLITAPQIDSAPILRSSREAFQGAARNINNFRPGSRGAVLSNMFGAQLRSDASTLAGIAGQNKGLRFEADQFNIGQKDQVRDLNLRTEAATDAMRQEAFTTVGNTGRALNQRRANKEAVELMAAGYGNNMYNYLMDDVKKLREQVTKLNGTN